MAIQIHYATQALAQQPLAQATTAQHILLVVEASQQESLSQLADYAALQNKLERIDKPLASLAKQAQSTELANGAIAVWVMLDEQLNTFQLHTRLRLALQTLLDEQAQHIAVVLHCSEGMSQCMSQAVLYVAGLNGQPLPHRKSAAKPDAAPADKPLQQLSFYATQHAMAPFEPLLAASSKMVQAVVAGNHLCRQLTMLPPNELNPSHYRARIKQLAQQYQWQWQEYDMAALRKMGAGAFVAVGQGTQPEDAAIVHLQYVPNKPSKKVAIIGKGICFDTGGHNLKPPKYMHGMHEDMNGSAVALGCLLAATQADLEVQLDVWLAIAQNHISPSAYKQNDVVTALNGSTIEIMHTDAEGRMVLADTLTLASRLKPDWMIDFATLTGSMVSALADRYSGVIANRPALAQRAVEAGAKVGERVCAFPFDEDYDEELESKVADIKQCTLEGGGDHIHAARFLSKFIQHDVPWLHVDLSCYNHKGGLGAVASDVNGFGVALTMQLLRQAE